MKPYKGIRKDLTMCEKSKRQRTKHQKMKERSQIKHRGRSVKEVKKGDTSKKMQSVKTAENRMRTVVQNMQGPYKGH